VLDKPNPGTRDCLKKNTNGKNVLIYGNAKRKEGKKTGSKAQTWAKPSPDKSKPGHQTTHTTPKVAKGGKLHPPPERVGPRSKGKNQTGRNGGGKDASKVIRPATPLRSRRTCLNQKKQGT